ncbi:MAG: N-acetyltransferase [Hungatella sp.]|nr:N-acetyltransferase [Hungatella sp.]
MKSYKETDIIIRNEGAGDYREVETVIRNAFWNIYAPGCSEHYLAHIMRGHRDFVEELDLVAELGGRIVGNVMYTRSRLIDESGQEKQILTFGPVSVLPEFQRQGIGRRLLEFSFDKAVELGYDAIVIFGSPGNYVSMGFKSCKRFNVCLGNGVFPSLMLVKELKEGVFDGRRWFYHESLVYNVNEKEAERFDREFEEKERRVEPCQEEFYIYSHSIIRDLG